MKNHDKAPTNVVRLLQSAGIPFEVKEYSVEDEKLDALSIAAKTQTPPEQCFKTLVTESPEHEHFVFVVPATAGLDLKKAAKAAKVKSIRMILQKELLPLTGYIHGGCSPIGMKKAFPTFISETAQLFDFIGVSGGRIGVFLWINPQKLLDYTGAAFADIEMS